MNVRAALAFAGLAVAAGVLVYVLKHPRLDLQTQLIRGKVMFEEDRYLDAEREFSNAIASAPNEPLVWRGLATALLRGSRDNKRAAELFRRVLDRDPKDAGAWFGLGVALRYGQDDEAAAAAFAKAKEIAPDDIESTYYCGDVLHDLDRDDEAKACFERVLVLDPDDTSALYQLGQILRRTDPERSKGLLARHAELTRNLGQAADRRKAGEEWSALLAIRLPRSSAPPPPELPFAVTFEKAFELALAAPSTALAYGDVDGDGDADVLASGSTLLKNDGHGVFAPAANEGAIAALRAFDATTGVLVDFDNDRDLDLLASGPRGSLFLVNDGTGSFSDATTTANIGDVRATTLVPFDSDHEGDVDVLVLDTTSHVRLLRNNLPPFVDGKSAPAARPVSFTDVSAESGVHADGAYAALAIGDVENGNDSDIVALAPDAAGLLFTNLRGNHFAQIGLAADVAALRATAIEVADFDQDGWIDLAFAAPGGGVKLARNRGDGTFAAPETLAPFAAMALAAVDFDNDGRLDLAVGGADGLHLLRNGERAFADVTAAAHAPAVGAVAGILAVDVDEDQDVDLVVRSAAGALLVLRNDGGNGNPALELSLRGFRSNAFGLGAKVEVRRGGFYALRVATQPTVQIGLGGSTKLDDLYVVWPNGVRQHYLNVDAESDSWVARREVRADGDPDVSFAFGSPRRFVIQQIDRRGGSCPLLYTWDGAKFRFVTDVLCSAPLGLDIEHGERALPNPDDWFRIPPEMLVVKDGRYELRVTEELREITYLDRAQLVVLDHASDAELFTSNGFTFPPFPPFRTYAVTKQIAPVRALDDAGADVTARVAASDRQYVDSFRRANSQMQGIAEMHTLTLEFPKLPPRAAGAPLRLFLDGWFYWSDSSVNQALAQDGSWRFTPPLLEVGDGHGGFTPAGMAGLPAGDSKLVVCELPEAFDPADPRVRITTNLQVYWDRVFIAAGGDDIVAGAKLTALDPIAADLRYRGYSRRFWPDGKEPHIYDYDDVAGSTALYSDAYFHHTGRYTKFGDVLPLVLEADDRYAIMDHGDEIALSFDATKLPPLQPGTSRTVVLHLVGWAKDGDHNAANATTVAPLPFLSMSGYPYPARESYPNDAVHRRYQEEWNTRVRAPAPQVGATKKRAPMPAFAEAKHFVLTDVTAASGVDFRHAEGRVLLNLEDTMGSGAAWGDVDGDGDDDLFLVQGRGPGYRGVYPGMFTSKLYRNDGGMRFTDVTAISGAGIEGSGMAALFADLDGDGDQDLFVTNYGANVLLENDGHGNFTDVTEHAGVALQNYNSGVAAGDYDKDGDLDLYIGRYVTIDEQHRPQEAAGYQRGFVRDDPPSVLPMTYPPAPKVLLRNDGGMHFTDVTAQAGVADELGKTLGVLFIDLDEDGWLDLLVVNDVTPNNFFRNLGNGTFESLAFDVGLDDPRGGMGVGAYDADGDLDYDLAVTYWQTEPNAIYRNNLVRHQSKKSRVPAFQDVANDLGFARASIGNVGWGFTLADLDNDTRADALVVDGYTSPDYETTMLCEPQSPLLFRGRNDGAFDEITQPGYASILERKLNGRGVAVADADRDGDLDIAITQNNGPAILLRNDGGERAQWLAIDLEGTTSARDPAGARVEVKIGDRTLTRQLFIGSSYLCCDSKTLLFGLGAHATYDAIRVLWPSGKVTTLDGGPARKRLRIREP